MPGWKLALRQGFANKRPLLAVGVAILAAITVLAATPIYFATLTDLGLRHGLTSTISSAFHIQVIVPLTPLEPVANARARQTFDRLTDSSVGWLVTERRVYTEVRPMPLSRPGGPVFQGPESPRGFLHSLSQVEEHLQFLDGTMPRAGVTMVDGVPQVEGIMGPVSARSNRVTPGDIVVLNRGSGEERQRLRVRVSGIAVPKDPTEEYWLGSAGTFLGPLGTEDDNEEFQEPAPAGFLVPEETLLEGMTAAFPGLSGSSLTVLYTDVSRISADSIGRVKDSLNRLSVDLTNALPRALTVTQLDTSLSRFEERLFFSRIPLLILILLMELVVLYALSMVASLLIGSQRGDMALVVSRGASPLQVLMVHGMQGVLLAGVGLLAGPPLAALGVASLGLTPPFTDLTGGTLLPMKLLPSAYLWGLGGALLCIVLLVWPALGGRRSGLVQHKLQRGRPPGLPLVQRYYLDVGMVLVAGLFLWNLTQQDSLVTRGGLGGLSVDQILLVTPLIFLAAVALLLLRLFPLLLGLLGRLGGLVLPAWAGLGLWQMARRPAFYSQLLLLVALAVSLGWFGATFGATLERSVRDRALYRTAVDFSIQRQGSFPLREVDDLESYFTRVPGVEAVTTAYEGYIRVGASQVDYPLLAVDPRNAANIFWYRDDFSEATLMDLMVALGGATETAPRARELPLDAEMLGLWVKPHAPYHTVFLWVVFRDAVGSYVRFTFGDLGFDEWRYLEVPLRTSGGTLLLIPPATLEAVMIYQPTVRQGTAGRIHLDAIQVTTASSPEPFILEGFESLVGWTPLATSPTRVDEIRSDPRQVKEGQRSVAFRFGRETLDGVRGLFLDPLNGPIPILASPDFLAGAGAKPGDRMNLTVEGVLVPMVVQEVVDYFPPLDPQHRFVIAPIDPLLDYLNLVKSRTRVRPNQILLDLAEEPARRQEARAALEERGLLEEAVVVDRQEVLAELELDPLMVAGWRGLVLASFVVLLLMIAVGYLSYSFLVARDRRLEMGIQRALGLARGDIFRQVMLEHGLLLGLGGAVGTWAGIQLSRLMIPLVTFTEGGRSILPPFLVETSWPAILTLLAGLLLGVVATVLLVGTLLARVSAPQALRTGEP